MIYFPTKCFTLPQQIKHTKDSRLSLLSTFGKPSVGTSSDVSIDKPCVVNFVIIQDSICFTQKIFGHFTNMFPWNIPKR